MGLGAAAAAIFVAALHIATGLFGVAVMATSENPGWTLLSLWVFPLQMLVFSLAAGALVLGSGGDRRVLFLGATFALIATSFARQPMLLLEESLGHPLPLAILRGVRVDALLPLFVWLFFRDFPRGISSRRLRLLPRIAIPTALVAGLGLIACNVARVWIEGSAPLEALSADNPASAYWAIVYGLTGLAFPYGFWKTRMAELDERRRVQLLAGGIALAAVPMSIFVLAVVTSSAFAEWAAGPGRNLILPFLQLLILSIPLTTAYAVLVDRALPVRIVVRGALQYALSRGVVTAGAALPFAWIVWYIYALRGQPVAEIMRGTGAIGLLAACGLGALAVRARRNARDIIDRTFFREEYDARQILSEVAVRSFQVTRSSELGELLATEIDRALHLDSLAVLFLDPLAGELRSVEGAVRALPAHSSLATRLAEAAAPVAVDLELPEPALDGLPTEDFHWLADCGARLLVPLNSNADDLIGLLALGDKRSELPFNAEDRQLLGAIAASGAVSLENRLRLGSAPPAAAGPGAAAELEETASACQSCGLVQAERSDQCGECSAALAPIPLPLVLHGKFHLERRVGEGGMGVVYRARDLALDRAVAIKTLPRAAPEAAERLRREARTMASVVHPNLVVVYAAETWKGTPMLVTEFLEAGTLTDRIEESPLPLDEALELGGLMASALERVHRAGILHRDVKPSNIGYTAEGVPKLLDFGLSRVIGEERRGEMRGSGDIALLRTTQSEQGIVGTPLYMSPEALGGRRPDPAVDLWSLAVVLYEAISGRNPVERASWDETFEAITRGLVPDLRETTPEVSPAVAEFFQTALHVELRRRPASAHEFRERWTAATAVRATAA